MSEAPELELRSLRKSFDNVLAVDRCDLALRRGEIVALLGASGCGKSTLLNMIAGFDTPDFGTILLRGEVINRVPPYRRNVAMVFQHYAMFPHLTVAENIAYGLHARRLPKGEIAERVGAMVALLKLDGLAGRYPAQLSGGQRQRVAVARALAIRPDMLLLDEAFSALDRNLREDMQLELSLLLRRLQVTTILVTHDQREAFALADRVAVMEKGRIAQIGTAEEVYRRPESSYVLRFLGTTNQLRAVIRRSATERVVEIGEGLVFAEPKVAAEAEPGPVLIDLRAEDIKVSTRPTAVHTHAPGIVALRTFLGAQERIVVDVASQRIVIERSSRDAQTSDSLAAGQEVFLDFDPACGRVTALA